jgi:eukaryotic-like serine/threonine-protein kinase
MATDRERAAIDEDGGPFLMPDQKVLAGRYELEEVLGHGGMAEVFLGTDRVLGRRIAIKVLADRFARDSSFVARFRREAQSAAALNHPNVVSVFDTGSDDGTHFIVMEYVRGKTLSDVIREDAPLMPERAAEIAEGVAQALAFAHRGGIIHRDVKPGNIMLTGTGDVKVMDFGIARATASESLTQTATVLGTATYFSPEQAQGEPVDARSDIYSLGIVLYEMLTGQPPFAGDSAVTIAYKHVREEPIPPSQLNPDVPAGLEAIVMKCLAKNPANRYQTVDELLQDLGRFLAGQPVRATPLLAPAATELVQRATRPTTVLPAPTTEETDRRRKWIAGTILGVILLIILVGLFFLARSLTETGGTQVAIPNVIGKTEQEARTELEGAGFKVGTVQPTPSADVAQGLVLDYDPKGSAVKGTTINLKVSSGPGTVKVPNVLCRTKPEAVDALQARGLKVKTSGQTEQNPDCKDPSTVARTDPPIGEQAAVGTTVTLFLTPSELKAPSAPNLAAGSDSGASNDDNITNKTTLTFSGTAEPGVKVTLFRDGADVANTNSDSNGDWNVTDPGPVGDGTHTYTAVASDDQGSTSPSSQGTDVTVDTAAPSTTITSGPENPTTETSATFEFEASEGGVTFACQLDGGGFQECTSPQTYDGLAPGDHTFEARATDAAGNQGSAASFTWTIEVV